MRNKGGAGALLGVGLLLSLWSASGAEFNAELERGRELEAGDPQAEDAIQLPPRDVRKRRRR